MVKRGISGLALAAVAVVGPVASAGAGTYGIVLFDDATTSGHSFSYDGKGGPLTGIGFLDTIFAGNVPTNNLVPLTCDGCSVEYRTNENLTESVDAWQFRYGGAVSITGVAKNGDETVAAGTLLRGYFNDTTHVVKQGPLHVTVSGSIAAQLDDSLADFYGLERNFWDAEPNGLAVLTQIGQLRGSVDPMTYSFDATATDTDVNYVAPIPAPAALPLLLTALGGLGVIGWRRKSQTG